MNRPDPSIRTPIQLFPPVEIERSTSELSWLAAVVIVVAMVAVAVQI